MSADPRVLRWGAIDPADLWAPLRHHFPPPPARVLDVGAGSGRDAAWFAGLGYSVTCAEPDRSLWPEGAAWVAEALPALASLSARFDLITLVGVWHLVPEADCVASLDRLGQLSAPDARLILSLRVPPLAGADQVVSGAQRAGWHLHELKRRPSVQAGNRVAGVMWDWCVFGRVASA